MVIVDRQLQINTLHVRWPVKETCIYKFCFFFHLNIVDNVLLLMLFKTYRFFFWGEF